MKTKLLNQFISAASLAAICQSCAPLFSELQSARTVGKNKVEVTPSASLISFSEHKETARVQNHFGTQLAYGITSKIDLRLRYEYIWFDENIFIEEGVSLFSFGPKFSLFENKIAFSLPLGKAIGSGYDDTWQLHPTMLFTIPAIKDKMDINISPKYLIIFCEDCDELVAINFGLSFSSKFKKWAIRPEYGILFNPGETGHYTHISLGVSATFGK